MKQKYGKKTLLTGITVLVLLVVMLGCMVISAGAETTRTAYCEHCKATVTWEPMEFQKLSVPDGADTVHKHYYLTANRERANYNDSVAINPNATMCLDLNGYTWEANNRAFILDTTANSSSGVGGTLNLMDSVGTGQIIGHSDANVGGNESGGVFYLRAGSTLNIYGGTYKLNVANYDSPYTKNGGIILMFTYAKTNVYGGTIVGGRVATSGGAICSYSSSNELNLYGGCILSGKAKEYGNCIAIAEMTSDTKYRITGDAEVDEIMLRKTTTQIKVDAPFTGSVTIKYRSDVSTTSVVKDYVVGTGVAGSLDNGYIVYSTKNGLFRAVNDGTNLKLEELPDGAQFRTCAACDSKRIWLPFDAQTATSMPAGEHHYYLEQTTTTSLLKPGSGLSDKLQLCLDLNGCGLERSGGNVLQPTGDTVINIMDSGTGGYIQGASGSASGGVMYINGANTVVNLYSGTLKFKETTSGSRPAKGGVVAIYDGAFNMYGGTVEGTQMNYNSSINATGNGSGGAIFMYNNTKLGIYGGEVKSGTAYEGKPGPCVYVIGKGDEIELGGDAKVEDIYFAFSTSDPKFSVMGTYTGTAAITFPASKTLSENLVVGTAADADLSEGTIRCTNSDGNEFYVVAEDGKLILTKFRGTVAANGDIAFESVQAAVDAYEGGVIRLYKSVNEDVVVTKNVTIQLAGYNLGGNITVAEGATLYCMDESTDDFDVSDGAYSKLTGVTGNVAGAETESAMNYLAINEEGVWSFHAVKLEIYAMTLSVDENGQPGLYYKSDFKADEMAAEQIATFGVALSVFETPNAANLEGENVKYTVHDHFEAGPIGNLGNNASTLLKGILKEGNSDAVNKRNLNIPVYGRAYARSTDGQILFGAGVCRNLAQQLQGVDDMVETLSQNQTAAVVRLYNKFKNVLKECQLPAMKEAVETEEEGTLKILVIGNSHGLDATQLLYEVFYAEQQVGNFDQKVVVGAIHKDSCMIHMHKNHLTNNEPVYEYYKNDGSNPNRAWTKKQNATCLEALQDEQWDYIFMQQMNYRVGEDYYYGTGSSWRTVAEYILNNQDIKPNLGFHMTWTNPDGDLFKNAATDWQNNHKALYVDENGEYSQSILYSNIIRCVNKYLLDPETNIMGEYAFNGPILASATAIEYAQVVLGRAEEDIYRDRTHLTDYGRLMVSYLWYAQITGLEEIKEVNVDAISSTVHKSDSKYPTADSGYAVTEDMKADIIASVNWALKNPYSLPNN